MFGGRDQISEWATMEVIKDIAESIDDMVKFTVDYPGNHKSTKLPILDVEASMNKEKQNKVEFEFYEKPKIHNKVILSDSAIPTRQKRTILTQEWFQRSDR